MSLDALRRATRDAVLAGPGTLDSSVRQRAASGEPPAELSVLVDKIRNHAYRVTDADIDALRGSYTEDQIFEIVIAATIGAAEHRLERARAALERA